MHGKKGDITIREYLETAAPEEHKEFAEALLSSRKKIDSPTPSIPESTIRASRRFFVVLAIFYVISLGWSEALLTSVGFLVLLGAIAWLFLLLFGVTAALEWGAAT